MTKAGPGRPPIFYAMCMCIIYVFLVSEPQIFSILYALAPPLHYDSMYIGLSAPLTILL